MTEFCSLNGLKNLINEPIYYKNSQKPTCIDLILTNQPSLFQRSTVFEKLPGLKWVSKDSDPILLLIGTTKNYDVFRSEFKSFCSLSETDMGLLNPI